MMVRFVRPVVIAAAVSCSVGSPAVAQPTYHADRLIVKPRRDLPATQALAAHAAVGAQVHRQYPRFGNLQVLRLPRGLSVNQALARYRASGLFEYAEPDYTLHISVKPDDLYFTNGTLYGMSKISAPAAWDTRTEATNVIVAVIDTGARLTHEDLAANIWSNTCVNCPVNGIVYSNDFHGINAITGTGNPADDHGHGTHVSGTVGAVGNNAKGVVGVCWRVQIMPLKFITSGGYGFTSDAIECINYAVAKGAHILSNSWGGGGDSQAMRDAIAAARDAGIIVVFAAGNASTDNDVSPFYPAAHDADNLVAVTGTDSGDNQTYNYGRDTVDLGAPGVDIYSTTVSSDSSYGFKNGTSMACPHVAGALALVKAQFFSETYTQLIQRVLGTVDPLASLSSKCVTGGRLNVANALTNTPRPVAEFTFGPRGAPPLSVTFTNHTLGATTNLTWNFGDGNTVTGIENPTHLYATAGTFNVTLTAYGLAGTGTRIKSFTVATNYLLQPAPFVWVDPTGMTALTLGDDHISSAQTIPFPFVFYSQTNTTVFIGSNGQLGFNSSGLASNANYMLPATGAPNNLIAPYWADFNPAAAGQVYVGTTGTAPNRVFVAAWVNVRHVEDTSASFTVEALLHETTQQIIFQYQDVAPTNAVYGGGRAATIGVENAAGTVGLQFGGTLTNNQALAFLWPTDDADGDGLPNGWEIGYGLDPLTADATADADGDGFSNASEFYAGTSPTDAMSLPHVQEIVAGTPDVFFAVPSVVGKTYRLQQRDAMDAGDWTDVSTNLLGDGSVLILTHPGGGSETQQFYRVKISP
jgi:subtilisin family serine protease